MSIQLLLSVIVASATVSTAVATGVTLWLRFRERPEPDWVLTASTAPTGEWIGGSPPTSFNVYGQLTNVGDGNAFRVTVEGVCAENTGLVTRTKHPMGIGLPLSHLALCGPGSGSEWGLNCEYDRWDEVAVVLAWTISPTRKGKRRKQTFRLADMIDRPRPTKVNGFGDEVEVEE